MDQSINLFTQSWAVAPPPALFSNLSPAPIPLLFLRSAISAWQKPSERSEPRQTCGSVTHGSDADGSP